MTVCTIDEDISPLFEFLELAPSTEKIVLVCLRENLAQVLKMRNDLAIEHGIPSEVKHFSSLDPEMLSAALSGPEIVGVFLGASDPHLNYSLLNAAHIAGKPVHFLNDGQLISLPTPSVAVSRMLSPSAMDVLKSIGQFGPIGAEELSRLNGFTKDVVQQSVFGGPSAGMAELGLVRIDSERLTITPLGRMVLNS